MEQTADRAARKKQYIGTVEVQPIQAPYILSVHSIDAETLNEAFTMGYKQGFCVAAKLCVMKLEASLSAYVGVMGVKPLG